MLKLHDSVQSYTADVLVDIDKRVKTYTIAHNIINILIFVLALGGAVMTPIIMSMIYIASFPEWFFYATAGIAAGTAFLGGLLNFFLIKEELRSAQRERVFVEQELIKYNNKLSKKYKHKDANFYLYTSIASIRGSKAAKKEAGLE